MEMQCALGMGHRLHHRRVAAEQFPQDILRVTGGSHPQDLQLRTLLLHVAAQLRDPSLGILDGIPFRQTVSGGQHLPIRGEQRRLGGGGAGIDTEEGPDLLSGAEGGRPKRFGPICLEKAVQLQFALHQPAGRGLLAHLPPGAGAEMLPQRFDAAIGSLELRLLPAELDGADGGEEVGVAGSV